jgi:hypothetical protein
LTQDEKKLMANLQGNESDCSDLDWLAGSIAGDEGGAFEEQGEKEYSSFENQTGA